MDQPPDPQVMEFRHLTRISYMTADGNPSQVHDFIMRNNPTLRSIELQNRGWTFPSKALSVRNLTYLDFSGRFSDVQAFCDVFSCSHQLEYLAINCGLECTPSPQLRMIQSCLPFLQHFPFSVFDIHPHISDQHLFPALTELLRNRAQLKSLKLSD
jgi:hypothetical protein